MTSDLAAPARCRRLRLRAVALLAVASTAAVLQGCGAPARPSRQEEARQPTTTASPATTDSPATTASPAASVLPSTVPPVTGTAITKRLGIFVPRLANGTIRTSADGLIREAKALGVRTVRVEQDVTAPLAASTQALQAAGLDLVLTSRYNPAPGPTGRPTVYPPASPEDLASYAMQLATVLDQVRPVVLAVENEEVGSPFVSGTAEAYLAELRVSVDVAHAAGVPVVNGGITSATAALLTWQDLHARDDAAADDFARRAFRDQRDLRDELLAEPFTGLRSAARRAAMEKGAALLAGYRALALDAVNFHWYGDDPEALRQVITFLRAATGHEVVSHETGQYSSSPEVLRANLAVFDEMRVPLVIWFDADGDPAVGLHDEPGVLRPNGVAFRDIAAASWSGAPPPR